MPTELTALLYPKSVAIIGASRSPEKLGAILLKNIQESGFTGELIPVNPNATDINGLKTYPDMASIPSVPELAVISVPAALVLESLEQIGEKGTKNVVVISAGFKELGKEGAELEKKLVEIGKKYEINLLGPNCLGFINNMAPINATFGEQVKESGNLRFISQSGAIASSLFDWCNTNGVGISEFITLGNKAILNENDFLEYFHEQSQNTLVSHNGDGLSDLNPIGLYLESIAQGSEFLKITSEITKTNPVLVLKPGKSKAAAAAMQSHTGSIAGEDSVLDAVLHQAGVIRCNTLEDFFDYSRAFSWENLPQGPRVAVISNAGGPAVISADAIIAEGLEMAQFEEEISKKLEEALPRSASIINPVDVLGDALADRFAESLELVMESNQTDSVVVILTPQLMTQIEETAETIGQLSKKHKKPIFCSFIGGHLVEEGSKKLNQYKIPSFDFPERAIAAVGAMWEFKQNMGREDQYDKEQVVSIKADEQVIRPIIQNAVKAHHKTLDNLEVDTILKTVGINSPPTQACDNYEQAHEFANTNGWPVVLKLASHRLLHKKDVGGVIAGIMNEKRLRDSWHQLERKVEQLDDTMKEGIRIQIQKSIQNGVEVLIGLRTDPTFGPVLLFGAGGSYAQLISDRNLHLLPLDLSQAEDLVKSSKVYKLLEGSEHEPAYALDKLYELIVKVSKLATVIPEATDIELNPAIVTLNDVWAVDGKVVLQEAPKQPKTAPKMMTATCVKHETLATTYHHFDFKADVPLEFKPGQYISVKVSPDAIRAYSVASHTSPTEFSLLVDVRPGGPGSQFFDNLKEGDKMTYLGPFGVFTLNLEDEADELLMMATGSGNSATRCMIDVALKELNYTKPIKLYMGLTKPEEIFWQEHFEELKKQYPNFNYEIVVYEPDESWSGLTGFITDHLDKEVPDATKCAAYLCGHRNMIAEASEILLAKGCPSDRIYQERFV